MNECQAEKFHKLTSRAGREAGSGAPEARHQDVRQNGEVSASEMSRYVSQAGCPDYRLG